MKKNNVSDTSKYDEIVESYKKSNFYSQFKAFDPYLTYSNSLNDRFIKPSGDKDKELTSDTEALFNIGLDAYKLLISKASKAEFDNGNENYFNFIGSMRAFLIELVKMKVVSIKSENDENLDFDFETLESGQILDIIWKIYLKNPLLAEDDEEKDINFVELYAYHSLREIDHCLVGIFCDGRDAICSAIYATQALSNATAIASREDKLIEARRELAYRGAIERIKRDPKQKALKEIKLHYESQKDQFKRRGYTAQFIREMHSKYPIITEQKTIASLVAKLNKANELIPR